MADELACATCGTVCRPEDRFCSQCGRKEPTLGLDERPTRMVDDEPTVATIPPEAPAPPGDPPLLPGQTFAHRYRIERLLGEGGMGRVYAATDTSIDETIAVKVLSLASSARTVLLEQFKRELKLARKVRHRNVVASFDLGHTEGRAYITMEFIDAESLAARVGRRGPLRESEALEVMRQVLRGLKAAHDLGIVHRDVKASNILYNRDRMAFITDFGIASNVVQGGSALLAGTPQYMAPELFDNARPLPTADLYACGVLLHLLLAGRIPFQGKTLSELARAHGQDAPEPLPQALAVSEATRGIIARLLAKDPAARPQRAVEVLEQIDRARGGEPGESRGGKPFALVVEPDLEAQRQCREALEAEGFHVEITTSAEDAAARAFSREPALVLLDSGETADDLYGSRAPEQVLPGYDAMGFCRLLRADEQLRRVPIVVLNRDHSPGAWPAFHTLGATARVDKPFRAGELAAAARLARGGQGAGERVERG